MIAPLRFLTLILSGAWLAAGQCAGEGCFATARGLVQHRAQVKRVLPALPDVQAEQGAPELSAGANAHFVPRQTFFPRSDSDDELYEGCKAKHAKARPSLQEVSEGQTVNVSKTACGANEVRLLKYSMAGVIETCCPAAEIGCAGCAEWSSACTLCSGGFVQRAGSCVACLHSAGWVTSDGRTCQQLGPADCSDVKFHGLSSNEACCHCGGGVVSPTPFVFETKEFVVGEDLHMAPKPRTADRYGVDEECALTEFNLTLDGSTGEVMYAPGRDKPQEPFTIACKVTAYQAAHIVYTAALTVSVKDLTYGAMPLVFASATSFPLRKTAGHWSNLALSCAPKNDWLVLDAATGSLTNTAEGSGAVDNIMDTYEGQVGGVCEVSGNWTSDPALPSHKKTSKLLVVKPMPLASLQYSATSLSTAVGEKIPAVELKQGSEEVLMPFRYTLACDDSRFVFDSLLAVGMFDGHPIIQVASNGQIVLDVPKSFEGIFDAMLGKSSTEAWSISFACKVFGDFADPGIPTISADLAITIRDTTCWAEDTVMGLAEPLQPLSGVAPADEGSCRKLCRVRSSCAYYKWDQGNCSQVVKRADGGWLQAIAKIWNCSNTDTCREVRTATWYYNGIYCPVGADTLRNSVIYFKEGTTPQEELVLYQHREAVDGAIPGCLDGSWVIKLSSRADYKKPQMGYFEMHGEARHCASSGEVLFATLPCGPPENITEEEVKVQKIILDDPATPAGADFWLHPCECASAAWGADMPVDPVTYEMTGDAETATYIPPPLMLVNGEFVCPNRNLLPNPGVYFETEAESMEYEVCEAKCKNHDDCNFFWHGTQSSATSCRLYSSCDSLVREIGLEGELTAMPRAPGCVVANPQECFTVSMRRQYLTSVAPATFFFWDLHAQCDMMLLLGGAGISACGRPTYRPPDYGDWRHKKKLPASFEHGNTLKVSCWNERYSAVRGSQGTSEEVLTCVNGNWFSSADEPGLGSFNCFECVQVASNGFNKIEERREQELYFFNRMELSVHSEVNQLDSGKMHCMEMKEPISEGVPAGPPSGKSWLAEAKPLYERKPTDVWKMEFLIYSANDKRTFDEEKKWAEDQGGHLVTFAEAWNWIIENPFFFADRGIDMWMPTLEPDGTRDYIQIGRPAWAVSGQSHNSGWGWPGWADDKALQNWGSGERGLLYWKKITIIGSTRELEKNKYQVFRSNAPQPYGGDPRRTWNESKAWVEKQGGRLMTKSEATLFFFNHRYYIDQGLDMWVPVEEADGTRDWIQGGNVHWAAPGTSHTAVFGRAAWEDDISLQGWTPSERILAWKQKEMVTASVWPGDVIALRNAHWGSFARAHSPIMDASGESEIPMPKEWTWERFTVVDAGSNGDVALHNFYHNGFARIRGSDNLADLLLFNFDAFDESWMAWERFQIVELGDGAIALYVPFLRRFLRMPGTGRQMDGSPQVGPLVAQNWVLEKFQVEHLDYAQSPGLVAWYKSEDAAPNWRSAVGDYAAHATHGEAKVYEAQGSGAAAPVRYVYGVAGDSRTPRVAYDFGHIMKPAYTICSVTRYLAAGHRGRILTGQWTNFLHGHWAGYVGVVHSWDAWQTNHNRNEQSTNWVVVCSSNVQRPVLVDGADIAIADPKHAGGDQRLVINTGPYHEYSDWAVMELMTWNYGLSLEEMKEAAEYLSKKVGGGQPDGCIYEVVNVEEVDRMYSGTGEWNADKSMLDNEVGGFCTPQRHCCEALDDWMQMDLKVSRPVSGVVIQGKYPHNGIQDWVWSFKVQYKEDVASEWNTIDALFTGIASPDEKNRVFFTSPVKARFIRLTHFFFKQWACMRAAVIVCNSQAPNEMMLVEESTCSTTFRVEKRPDSDPESRHLVLAGGGTGTLERCVAYGMHEGQETVFHKPCQPDDAAQLIPARGMGLLYFNLHSAGKVATVQRGLKAEFFYGVQASTVDCTLPDVSMRQPDYVRVDAQLDYTQSNEWSGITEKDWLAGRWTGFLTIQHAGHYKFFLKVDDTVEILIDGKVLVHVGHCGWHRDVEASMDLPAGALPFVVHWMEATGGMALRVFYQGPDTKDQKVLIPTSAFSHVTDANTQLMVDASHSRGCIGNTGISRTKGSVFAPSEKATGVVCSFVPVVKTDEPVVLPTSRKRDGHWPEWWVELSDMDIECSEGKVLMSIDTEWVDEKMRVAYTCGVVAGLGYCTPSWSDQRDAQDWTPNNQQILDKLMVACPRGSLLNRLKFEYSIGGRWARFKTSCCATGGAPVGILRNGPDASRFDAMEGQYCPSGRGPSGRFVYQQRPIGPWQAIGAGHALQFDHNSGTWCIGPQCSDPVPLDPAAPGNAEPTSLALASLDVGPVSDFDGNFEAKGVGGAAGANGNKYLNARLPKNPPKRPKPPKKPKLLVYEPEMPSYSDKCIQYGDLWKNLQETVVNDVGEETAEVSELETEQEENAGYQDAHPCDVAGDAGGTSGTIGGGDGSDTRDQMPYDQLDGCHARDIERALVDGKETYWHDLYQTNTGLASSIVGAVCAVIPIGAIEPFGAGISMDFAGVCDGIQAAVADTIMSAPAIRQAKFYYDMAQEDYADCNPLQTNFARLFCDIHCVRDAVVRGDRSIIRNLKQATDVTNKNLDQLSSWIVKSAQVDAGWLADKIDYAAAVNKRDFEKLMELLAGGDEKTTLVAIRAATETMKSELLGLAQAASFGTASALTARDALQRFADQAPVLQGAANASDAMRSLQALATLSARLHGAAQGRSKMDQLDTQLTSGIARMQGLARLNAKALGVYKHFLNASNHVHDGKRSKGLLRAQHEVLVSLDKIWWSLRGKMDKYFDAADKEVKSFMRSLAMMQDYQQCHSGYTDLLATYKTTMRVSGRTHALLRDTWRECSNLVGELAATIGDSDAFTTFLAKEGCASSLALQTRNQARLAMAGMRLLWHRFQVAGLGNPDTDVLTAAMQRLEDSYSEALAAQGCKN